MSEVNSFNNERSPFIVMHYEFDAIRKIYKTDWPEAFITAFESVPPKNIKVGYFFVMGHLTDITTIEKALAFCKA